VASTQLHEVKSFWDPTTAGLVDRLANTKFFRDYRNKHQSSARMFNKRAKYAGWGATWNVASVKVALNNMFGAMGLEFIESTAEGGKRVSTTSPKEHFQDYSIVLDKRSACQMAILAKIRVRQVEEIFDLKEKLSSALVDFIDHGVDASKVDHLVGRPTGLPLLVDMHSFIPVLVG
jgi:hypothetical protein